MWPVSPSTLSPGDGPSCTCRVLSGMPSAHVPLFPWAAVNPGRRAGLGRRFHVPWVWRHSGALDRRVTPETRQHAGPEVVSSKEGSECWGRLLEGGGICRPRPTGSVSVSLEHCRAIFKSRLKITRLVAELRKEATGVLPLSQKAAGRQGWPAWPGVQPRLALGRQEGPEGSPLGGKRSWKSGRFYVNPVNLDKVGN